MEKLELTDFLNYRFLAGPRFAPGGQRAAFLVGACDRDENTYTSRLWLWEPAGLRQLTDLGEESSFLWEDGTHLLFPACRSRAERKRREAHDAFTAYYRLDVNGGEALPAFTLPFAATGLWRLSGSVYAAAGPVDANAPDDYLLDSAAREKRAAERKAEADYEVLDENPFWFNGKGFINKKRTAVFLVDTAGGLCRRVSSPLFDLTTLAVHDGAAYFAGEEYAAVPTGFGSLWKLGPDGAAVCLQKKTPVMMDQLVSAGRSLLALGTDGARYGLNENSFLYRVDPDTGAFTLLRAEEESLYGSVGSDCRYGGGEQRQARGGELYATTTRGGSAQLYRFSPDGSGHPVVQAEGSIDDFAVCPESDTILLVALYQNRLQELYACGLNGENLRQVSHFNDAVLAGRYVAEPRPLTVESCGLSIEGWVLQPKDYDPKKRYPAILDIHGGPKTVYGPVFYHEMQLWANRGFFVLFCNPKGSDGRGNAFADIRGAYGTTDYQNLMDFTDAALAAWPAIDPARVGVTGGSYGGFMTNWILGHTGRFAAAASQRSIANWLSFWGVSDIGVRFAADQCAGDPFESPEALWRQSPLKYAKNAVTPTLFIHSDEDYRCPLPEGLQMYSALVARGVPARLCCFHGENHELSRSGKPLHRVRRLQEITRWLEKYCMPDAPAGSRE